MAADVPIVTEESWQPGHHAIADNHDFEEEIHTCQDVREEMLPYIQKIAQMILRSRVVAKDEVMRDLPVDLTSLCQSVSFWNDSIPLQIDVFMARDKYVAGGRSLLERWTVCYTNLSGKTIHDTTDLILLVQSLYSYIRLLPVHQILTDGSVDKSQLAYSISLSQEILASSQQNLTSGFDPEARLKVYNFKTAPVPNVGILTLSVTYDAYASTIYSKQPSTPTRSRQEVISPTPTKSPQVSSVPRSRGSPVPDPMTHQRLLAMSQRKLTSPSKRSDDVKIRRTPTFGSSPLSITDDDSDSSPLITPEFPKLILPSAPLASPIDNVDFKRPFVSPSQLTQLLEEQIHKEHQREVSSLPPLHADALRPKTGGIPISHLPIMRQRPSDRRTSVSKSWGASSTLTPEKSSLFSLSSELFGSLVGSYEESILSGRMSTLPSRPIEFECEIGVVGNYPKCPPQLKCPRHITIPFAAYFYDVAGHEGGGTPYVGAVDVEAWKNSKDQDHYPGYRLPLKGQLQIIIKNPARTAVKVFLVPYDLRDMPGKTRTFIRQKSYAEGGQRNSLRDVIHLQFISPAPKKVYLSKSIKVVFSHRGVEGEKMVVQVDFPQNPRYFSEGPQSAPQSMVGSLEDQF